MWGYVRRNVIVMRYIASSFKYHWKLVTICIALCIFSITLVLFIFTNRKETKYIAYVGRYDESGLHLDYIQERILRKYIDDLNKALFNFNIELITFNNLMDAKSCEMIYLEIAKNPDILFVVDNSWASEIELARAVIKMYHLPVFFLNADKNRSDFGNAAIFIGNADNFP